MAKAIKHTQFKIGDNYETFSSEEVDIDTYENVKQRSHKDSKRIFRKYGGYGVSIEDRSIKIGNQLTEVRYITSWTLE